MRPPPPKELQRWHGAVGRPRSRLLLLLGLGYMTSVSHFTSLSPYFFIHKISLDYLYVTSSNVCVGGAAELYKLFIRCCPTFFLFKTKSHSLCHHIPAHSSGRSPLIHQRPQWQPEPQVGTLPSDHQHDLSAHPAHPQLAFPSLSSCPGLQLQWRHPASSEPHYSLELQIGSPYKPRYQFPSTLSVYCPQLWWGLPA